MQNKKISTAVGTIVLLVVAVTIGMLVWKNGKTQPVSEQPQKIVNVKKQEIQLEMNNQNVPEGEEFPSILAEPNMSMEEIIKQMIFKRSPEWKIKNYSISVTVEISQENYAIGRFVYDNNKTEYHNAAEGIWFAAKENQSWTLVGTSYAGYWGVCQDFKKYKFPADMTPDCWDTEKNILIDTTNPKRFYQSGFTKADKKELVQAFIEYVKNEAKDGSGHWRSYLSKDLYVKVNKNTANHLNGVFLTGGSENISAPYFLATKQSGKWIVVHESQDYPICSTIDPYNFTRDIIEKCYDEKNKQFKEL